MEDDFEIPDEDLQRNEALPQKHQPSIVRKCNSRIDDLSQPNKRIFISLWNEHGHHLPKDKSENLKNILKQMFAMSPVETAKYFRELKAEARRKAAHRELKKEIRKFLANKRKDEDQKRAFIFFQKVLRHLLNYAVKNSIPAILSLKVRYLSDIILEELSNLRKVNVPCRLNPSVTEKLLISVADWMAIAMERLYYVAQVSMIETQSNDVPQSNGNNGSTPKNPLAASTPHRL